MDSRKESEKLNSATADRDHQSDTDDDSHLPHQALDQSLQRLETESSVTNSPGARRLRDSSDCKTSESTSPLADADAFSNLDNVDLPEYVREHNATLTFPEKLMLMLMHAERLVAKSGKRQEELPISWVNNGLAFVIRDKAELVSSWLPLFFRQAKFSSFTRKLYRWGFRQVNNTAEGQNDVLLQQRSVMYFGNENFQRDNKRRLSKMKSITAAGRRREQEQVQVVSATESKEQDFRRQNLESQVLMQRQHYQQPPQPHPLLNNNAPLFQLRNTQTALASLAELEHSSNPLLHGSHPLLQQAVARAQLQQQQLVARRFANLPAQDSSLGNSQYLHQLSQLLNPTRVTPSLSQQLLAIQQAQHQQQLRQSQISPQEINAQNHERLRSVYELLLQQIPLMQPGESQFLPPTPPPRPPDDET